MLVILTIGSPVLLLSVDERWKALCISNIPAGLYRYSKRCVHVSDVSSCQNFMNRRPELQ